MGSREHLGRMRLSLSEPNLSARGVERAQPTFSGSTAEELVELEHHHQLMTLRSLHLFASVGVLLRPSRVQGKEC